MCNMQTSQTLGVGKTAIAEGLAYAIVHRASMDGSPLPEFLANKRVMQLDVSWGVWVFLSTFSLEVRAARCSLAFCAA